MDVLYRYDPELQGTVDIGQHLTVEVSHEVTSARRLLRSPMLDDVLHKGTWYLYVSRRHLARAHELPLHMHQLGLAAEALE
jgi:hypothetical protein